MRYSLIMRSILPAEANALLREIAHDVSVLDIKKARIQNLIKEMKMLLEREQFGVAIAAPQVGESLRLFIVSGKARAKRARYGNQKENTDELLGDDEVYINPVLIKMSRGKKPKHEGCLSVRGKWGMVPRAERVKLSAFNEHGEKFERGASGLLAHIFQHELDHLDGILYTDKATELYDDFTEPTRQKR